MLGCFLGAKKGSVLAKLLNISCLLCLQIPLAYSVDSAPLTTVPGGKPSLSGSTAGMLSGALDTLMSQQPEALKPKKETPLRVGIIAIPPFTYYDVAGNLEGIAFELWHAVARVNNYKSEYIYIGQNSNAGVSEIKNGNIDIAIGPIGISSERIKSSDFTVPYFEGQYVLLAKKVHIPFFQFWNKIFKGLSMEMLFSLLGFYLIYLHLFWFLERGRIELKDKSYIQVMEILFTRSLLSKLSSPPFFPETRFVRIFSIVWVLAYTGMFFTFFAGFTATFVSSISATEKDLDSADDIVGKPIAVFGGSASLNYAERSKLNIAAQPRTLGDAIKLLDAGKVHGVFMLFATARSYIDHSKRDDLYISSVEFPHVYFGFLVKHGDSDLIRQINWAITKMTEDGIKLAICSKYSNFINFRNCQ